MVKTVDCGRAWKMTVTSKFVCGTAVPGNGSGPSHTHRRTHSLQDIGNVSLRRPRRLVLTECAFVVTMSSHPTD